MAAKRSSWLPLYVVIALVIAVFAAPSVDAAVCATEAPIAAAHAGDDLSLQTKSGNDGANERGDSHGICSHGHCHHGGAGRVDAGSEALKLVVGEALAPIVDDSLTSHVSERLKRPPRV